MYTADTDAQVPPVKATYPETIRILAAALHAKKALPSQVGQLVARELTAVAEFGYASPAASPVAGLVDEVLALPLPERAV